MDMANEISELIESEWRRAHGKLNRLTCHTFHELAQLMCEVMEPVAGLLFELSRNHENGHVAVALMRKFKQIELRLAALRDIYSVDILGIEQTDSRGIEQTDSRPEHLAAVEAMRRELASKKEGWVA